MGNTVDILDTVLLHLRIEEGKFIANIGEEVVSIEDLRRDGDGNVWVRYWQGEELVETLKYMARKFRDDYQTIDREW